MNPRTLSYADAFQEHYLKPLSQLSEMVAGVRIELTIQMLMRHLSLPRLVPTIKLALEVGNAPTYPRLTAVCITCLPLQNKNGRPAGYCPLFIGLKDRCFTLKLQARKLGKWHRHEDSNPNKKFWRLPCYRYTMAI